jgi:hypothetical protein
MNNSVRLSGSWAAGLDTCAPVNCRPLLTYGVLTSLATGSESNVYLTPSLPQFVLISDLPTVTHLIVLSIKQTPEVGPLADDTITEDDGDLYHWERSCLFCRVLEVEVTLRLTDGRYVLGLVTRYYFMSEGFCLKVAVLFLWNALSDERTGLQFAVQSLNGPSRSEPVTIIYCLMWDHQTWRATFPYLYPPRTGRPSYTPGHHVLAREVHYILSHWFFIQPLSIKFRDWIC